MCYNKNQRAGGGLSFRETASPLKSDCPPHAARLAEYVERIRATAMNKQFSVLMSLYLKEHAAYFEECMESLLAQTVLPDEIVIVEDGPLTPELYASVQRYREKHPGLIRSVPLPENRGLGPALAEGVLHCAYDLVARMDTDDISCPDRFELQLRAFEEDPALDICGGHILEFADEISNVLGERRVPLTHDQIARYQKQRSAFNHVTVMFKKEAVLRAGNYEDAPLMEDDMLWVRMLLAGARCANLDRTLVYVRTGYAMIERRGGFSYFLKYRKGRKMILQTGYIGRWDYFKTVLVQAVVALMPKKLRLWVFTKLLRTGCGQ